MLTTNFNLKYEVHAYSTFLNTRFRHSRRIKLQLQGVDLQILISW